MGCFLELQETSLGQRICRTRKWSPTLQGILAIDIWINFKSKRWRWKKEQSIPNCMFKVPWNLLNAVHWTLLGDRWNWKTCVARERQSHLVILRDCRASILLITPEHFLFNNGPYSDLLFQLWGRMPKVPNLLKKSSRSGNHEKNDNAWITYSENVTDSNKYNKYVMVSFSWMTNVVTNKTQFKESDYWGAFFKPCKTLFGLL